jgi:hypothetical protein
VPPQETVLFDDSRSQTPKAQSEAEIGEPQRLLGFSEWS